jgi:hypothetical protein
MTERSANSRTEKDDKNSRHDGLPINRLCKHKNAGTKKTPACAERTLGVISPVGGYRETPFPSGIESLPEQPIENKIVPALNDGIKVAVSGCGAHSA